MPHSDQSRSHLAIVNLHSVGGMQQGNVNSAKRAQYAQVYAAGRHQLPLPAEWASKHQMRG